MKTLKRDPIRDKKLIEEYQSRKNDDWEFTTTEVASHFEVSATRLHQILDFYKVQKRSSYDRQLKNK